MNLRVAAILLAGALVACGGDPEDATTDVSAASSTTTSRPAEIDETTSTTSATVTSTTVDSLGGEGIGDVESLISDLLITLDELNMPTMEDAGYVPGEQTICETDLDETHPAAALAGVAFSDEEGGVLEEIRVFASPAAAEAAYLAAVDAAACGTDSAGTAYGPATGVAAEVGADRATAVPLTNELFEGLLVVALISDAVVLFEFGDVPAPRLREDAPPRLDIAAFGVGKILAALEQG